MLILCGRLALSVGASSAEVLLSSQLDGEVVATLGNSGSWDRRPPARVRSSTSMASCEEREIVRWRGYPSWYQFAWLHLFSLGAGLRGVVGLRQDVGVALTWLAGALFLFACAVALRRWAEYLVTSQRVAIRNGYSGTDIEALALERIDEVRLMQGPFARFLGIGTILIRSREGDAALALRGVSDPEAVKARIDALR